MKILIVTFNSALNYGAILQEYALYKYLSSKKNQVEVLNYEDKIMKVNYKIFRIDNSSKKKLIKSIIGSIIHLYPRLLRYIRFKKYEKNILLTEKVDDVSKIKEKYEIMVVGSDQVWNTQITKGLLDVYSLNFGSGNEKKISYAASIGSDKISKEDYDEFRRKLKKIDYISVREEDGKKELEKILGRKDISIVIDPTLLLEKKEWKKFLLPINMKKKYILAYKVANNKNYYKYVNFISKILNLTVVDFEEKKLNKHSEIENLSKNYYSAGPREFLTLINNAEFIVTTSFHATLFSIIFEKNFIVLSPENTASRLKNILQKLKIEDRLVDNELSYNELSNLINKEINYVIVNTELEIIKNESKKWLDNTIK